MQHCRSRPRLGCPRHSYARVKSNLSVFMGSRLNITCTDIASNIRFRFGSKGAMHDGMYAQPSLLMASCLHNTNSQTPYGHQTCNQLIWNTVTRQHAERGHLQPLLASSLRQPIMRPAVPHTEHQQNCLGPCQARHLWNTCMYHVQLHTGELSASGKN